MVKKKRKEKYNKPHYLTSFSQRNDSDHSLHHEIENYRKLSQRSHPSCKQAAEIPKSVNTNLYELITVSIQAVILIHIENDETSKTWLVYRA